VADGLNVPPAPPLDQDHEAIPWPKESTAEANTVLVAPEGMVAGLAAAVTTRA